MTGIVAPLQTLSGYKRFLMGGIGAGAPILVSIIALDWPLVENKVHAEDVLFFLQFPIKYALLFLLGGMLAYLHENEVNKLNLFQTGVAAPSIVTGILNAALSPPPT